MGTLRLVKKKRNEKVKNEITYIENARKLKHIPGVLRWMASVSDDVRVLMAYEGYDLIFKEYLESRPSLIHENEMLLVVEKDEVLFAKDASKEATILDTDDASAVVDRAPKSSEKRVQMDIDAKVEDPEMIEKASIAIIESLCGGLSQTDLNAAIQQKICMVSQDRDIEAKDQEKKTMVNYLRDMRRKKLGTYCIFANSGTFKALIGEIEDLEDILKDEDESIDDVIFRFEEVKKKCDNIEQQEKEFIYRTPFIKQLLWTIGSCRRAIMSEGGLGWLVVRVECDKTEEWLNEKLKEQCALLIFASPVLLSADLRKKNEELIRM